MLPITKCSRCPIGSPGGVAKSPSATILYHKSLAHSTYRINPPGFHTIDYTQLFYFYLHLKMDILPGRTASMLRLDRFAHWIECDYENQILCIITKWPIKCQIMDFVLFENTRRRYSFAHMQRHFVCARSWNTLSLDCQNKFRESSPDTVTVCLF